MAVLAASLVGKDRGATNSALRVETNDSAMALSRAEPTPPMDGTMPASSSLLPNDRDVYWVPWSEWWINPGAGFLRQSAILRASATSSVRRWLFIAQPTSLLEQASKTKAR